MPFVETKSSLSFCQGLSKDSPKRQSTKILLELSRKLLQHKEREEHERRKNYGSLPESPFSASAYRSLLLRTSPRTLVPIVHLHLPDFHWLDRRSGQRGQGYSTPPPPSRLLYHTAVCMQLPSKSMMKRKSSLRTRRRVAKIPFSPPHKNLGLKLVRRKRNPGENKAKFANVWATTT